MPHASFHGKVTRFSLLFFAISGKMGSSLANINFELARDIIEHYD